MIKFIFTLILGIYIGAYLGFDRVNKATDYGIDKAKVIAKWVQTEYNKKNWSNNAEKQSISE